MKEREFRRNMAVFPIGSVMKLTDLSARQIRYYEEKGYCTMSYESVIGKGKIRILPEDEKMKALKTLMAQYHKDKEAYFNPAAIPRTLVYSLEVEEITAKRK